MNSSAEHPSAIPSNQLDSECDVKHLRRSGPGGQHRNKVETGVLLRHRPTGVTAEANERRSQSQNRSVALFRLRVKLALQIRTDRAAEGVPSGLWKSRCRGGRMEISTNHNDFPAILAEAMDVLTANNFDPKTTANQLGCTISQLIKLFKKESNAFRQVNQHRESLGFHTLR